MNKNIIIGIVVIVLALLGWAIYSSRSPVADELAQNTENTSTNSTATTPTTGSSANTTVKSTNTFQSIFNQDGSHVCTFEQVSSSSRGTSAIYIADGKMRGEFRTTTGAKTTADLMVYNGGTLYVWKEGMSVGTKSQIKTVADLPAVIPKDLTSGAILGTSATNASWDCHDWKQDDTILVPPTVVKFY